MKFLTKQIFLATIATALLASNCYAAAEEEEEENEETEIDHREPRHYGLSTRIVGGKKVGTGKYQFIASLNDYGYGHFCGGAILNPTWIITAAHCLEGGPTDYVIVGTHHLKKDTDLRQEIKVKRKIKHSGYNRRTFKNDIALIQLEKPIQGLKPIKLPDSKSKAFDEPGQMATTIGWGAIKENKGVVDELREVNVPIVSEEQCTAPGSYSKNEIFNTNVCAGYEKKNQGDSCQGDSGGPLFLDYGDDNQVLVGITSWGEGCSRPKKYGVYTRVSDYVRWITQKVKDVEIAPESLADQPLGGGSSSSCGRFKRKKCNKSKNCEWDVNSSPKCIPKST